MLLHTTLHWYWLLCRYNKNSMFPFGDFGEAEPYRTYELLFFILVGVMGGLLGAMFNAMNVHASVFRSKYVSFPFPSALLPFCYPSLLSKEGVAYSSTHTNSPQHSHTHAH